MTQVLRITDGVLGANLIFDSRAPKYQVRGGWAPAVAGLRRSMLSGYGPYTEVTEGIPVNIYGRTPAETLQNLAVLSQLLDQAERWQRGEAVNAVRIEYQPEGGSQVLAAIIIGRPENADAGLSLPVTFDEGVSCYLIEGVELRFVRRGLWLGASETPAASGAVANSNIMTCTFATSTPTVGPAAVAIGGFSALAANAYVLIASTADQIQIIEAESLARGEFTSVADGANAARGGAVARHAPVGLLGDTLSEAALTLPATTRRLAVFAAVRNNSLTATWALQATVIFRGGGAAGPRIQVDASSTKPRLLFLGVMNGPGTPQYLRFSSIVSAVAGGPTLDIDYFAVVALDDVARAVAVNITADSPVVLSAAPLTEYSPLVYSTSGTARISLTHSGDAWLCQQGSTLSVAVLATGTGSFAAKWVAHTSFGAVVQNTLTATRWPSYLTPQ